MATINWNHELVEQMEFHWRYHILDRMTGLSDEEYLWAPVAEVWTIHAGEHGGKPTIDPNVYADPAPFTTIAWRMHHMTEVFTRRWVNHFGDPKSDEMEAPVTLSANEAIENLTFAYERWKNALLEMPEDRLGEPCGPAEGPFAEHPFVTLVLHLSREYIHHASECCLIRDLYRQRETLIDPVITSPRH